MNTRLELSGKFVVEHRDQHGNLKKTYTFKNGVTNGGLNDMLDAAFGNGTQRTEWYLGLLDDGPTLAAADTMASHASWTENVDYDEANRPTWLGSDVAASQAITNASYVVFTMSLTAGVTIAGIFISSDNTKGGTSGILWATGLFNEGDVATEYGDTLNVTYTINAAAA